MTTENVTTETETETPKVNWFNAHRKIVVGVATATVAAGVAVVIARFAKNEPTEESPLEFTETPEV